MCTTCGCGKTGSKHLHAHEHVHDHPHSHAHDADAVHPHVHPEANLSILKLEQNLLADNDLHADENRRTAAKHGLTVLNLISAPGSGKTYLLERTLERLNGKVSCAVITGDLETDRDARRLADKGAWVHQIQTHQACHLSADQVGALLPAIIAHGARLLFVENVGNLVCPAAFDLGEHFKVALLSVTEGEDKPLKYPGLFSLAPVAILTKIDLLPHLAFDMQQARDSMRRIHPGIFIFELSAQTGEGMDAWIDYLATLTA
ncbi:MAG: hydrogenase accessory protein HypB [Lentisphaerae bacterium RIFOXYC12_FULL_60_16]|nr:MAG: hydrogenase accessory protein HypB [Lentisphaerae bacterium RIFOXYC12_FULL_60_16]OGV73718.1 MAG: hydrogenase accessory protein HypB [Lentisphaerae bacterium RIFOXYA12_FULL_60_10]OGV79338.1 MAG: hydrogenase accessory protein HypB [Lentisphaerae bacterium RIFOXYB12_FULL_60_10]